MPAQLGTTTHSSVINATEVYMEYYSPPGIPEIESTKSRLGCTATGTLIQCWWECKMVQLLKVNIHVPCNFQFLFWVYTQQNYVRMFPMRCVAALLLQPQIRNSPSEHQQWKEGIQVYSHHGKLLSHEKEEFHTMKWMNLLDIVLSERSQTQKSSLSAS